MCHLELTCKHHRIGPGQLQALRRQARTPTFVGAQSNIGTQGFGTQIGRVSQPKSPQTHCGAKNECAVSQPSLDPVAFERVNLSGELSVQRGHKRQLDTNTVDFDERPQTRSRINLAPGTKLARKFPHLVRQDDGSVPLYTDNAERGPIQQAPTTSNKRRRVLPFKTRGSGDSQRADTASS